MCVERRQEAQAAHPPLWGSLAQLRAMQASPAWEKGDAEGQVHTESDGAITEVGRGQRDNPGDQLQGAPEHPEQSGEKPFRSPCPPPINGPGNIIGQRFPRWPQVPREAGIKTLPKLRDSGTQPRLGQSVMEGCLRFL